ncbi:MAG: STAS domain-containing protein [Candidatus Omnitrophota bacterium]
MTLEVNVDKKGEGTFAVSCSGPIDSITHKELEKTLAPFLIPSTKVLILNMEGVTYISSMGISVVLKTKKAIEENKGSFIMTNLQPQIKVVFEIIKALPNMRIFESMEEADEYLSQIQRKEIEKRKGVF